MLTLGKYHTLTIQKETSSGLILSNKSGDEVSLPIKYRDPKWKLEEEIKVIVYRDGNHEIIATTETPLLTLNKFAYLKVKQINDVGAFCDWGTSKDLFIHDRNQLDPLEENYGYVVYMFLDETTNRLEGSTLIKSYLKPEADETIYKGKEVEVLVYERTNLGYQVIIDQSFAGLIYHDDSNPTVRIGHTLKGYVKPLREDKKIDISLQPFGFLNIEPNATILWDMLQENDGYLPFTDKSDPEAIRSKFKMSKKVFKKALGSLYKQKIVELKPDGIYKKSSNESLNIKST